MDSHTATALLEATCPGQSERFFSPLTIGDTPESADHGAELILSGVKTATSSAFWDYPDGRIPFAGALSLLLGAHARPRAVLETQRIEVLRFGDIDEAFAAAYGEGDRTLAWFKAEIGAWYRRSAARCGERFTDDTRIICEWFAVARRL
ncbi:MAG TPA: ASCH domain-containing protein [Noviherbaspirillum sp.]|jgi:uncharacterized protein YhfF|uniref:ASCH domain-containing protein n=1 Tax=Noviherbaspirillum sp. TaxID=1926288 RepID=UPI002F959CDC